MHLLTVTTKAILFTVLMMLVTSAQTWAKVTDAPTLEQQRLLYHQAKDALKAGRRDNFQRALTNMGDYPLKHYLIAMELFDRLQHYPVNDVRQYLTAHNDSPIARQLRYRWLNVLIKQDRWQDFLLDYQDNIATTEQQCYYQRIRIQHHSKSSTTENALASAIKLWSVGKSQPKGCDKLFDTLAEKGLLTEPVAWQRYNLALFNHDYRLAQYIKTNFLKTKVYRELADRFYDIDQGQLLASDDQLFKNLESLLKGEEIRIAITHGISHLAGSDATTSVKYWEQYRQAYPFNAAQVNRITSAIVKSFYAQDQIEVADHYLKNFVKDQKLNNPKECLATTQSLLEWRVREALKIANWDEAFEWISLMPTELRQNDRWSYWQTRTKELINSQGAPAKSSDKMPSDDTYALLSSDRSFYGFISSEWLGKNYSMAHRSSPVTPEQISAMEQQHEIVLTRELLYHTEYFYAGREWRQATLNFSQQQWITAAHIADQWHWYNGAINSMISAGFWDEIDLRFPLAFQEIFQANSKITGVPPHLLFAIARQESALSPIVTSPAGAKGLMQLMPATAKQTAKKNGVTYKGIYDLLRPDINITLGSQYYQEMLLRFSNNRILATAAYNAGPSRVNRWLAQSENKLPFDVWIETIPFSETRNYVQNVLAFSVIYAHQLGTDERILSQREKNQLL